MGRPDISSLRDQSQNGQRVNSNNIVMWETRHNNADKDCFQDSDFVGDLEDSKSTSGVHFWTPYICSCQLDVPEANRCLAQFCRV